MGVGVGWYGREANKQSNERTSRQTNSKANNETVKQTSGRGEAGTRWNNYKNNVVISTTMYT